MKTICKLQQLLILIPIYFSLSLYISCLVSTPPAAAAAKIENKVVAKKEIIISAAMSLKNAFNKIAVEFERENPDIKVSFNFAASGQLRAQIENGAPVDLFAPASPTDIHSLLENGYLVKETLTPFSKNSLVVVVPINSKLNISRTSGLESIMTKNIIRKIAIGNPATVAAGKYAMEAFKFEKINIDSIKDKIVYAENVRQALYYARQGEVDAALVFATDAKSGTGTQVKIAYAIPTQNYTSVINNIVVIKTSKHLSTAKSFIRFVVGKKASAIFKELGFLEL
ncbi:MAG: molybdate ABC transporter substrate-binding protein [Oligoflexia bacterium]|nr:molybdate ABC transporter substrate-binding protein [Oligoflexia bacterium]